MATIPTAQPTVDSTGYISNQQAITINETVSAVNKNEPIFGVGNEKLQGYIALELYEQHQASVIDHTDSDNTIPAESQVTMIYSGESYSSGRPFVTTDAVWTDDEGIRNILNG